MTRAEMRAGAVRLMRSRIRRNHYTNGGDRKYFWGKPEGVNPGYSDCSEAVRRAILRASGGTVDIGYNTDAQIRNRAKGVVLEMAAKGQTYPIVDKLRPGVCIYFRGCSSHALDVGHVEMVIDATTCIGHGSGTGPNIHNIRDYCRQRGNGSKGYLCLIDWLPDTEIQPLGAELLRLGDIKPSVGELQTALKALGYDLGTYGANKDGIDGEYGNLTKAAVLAFEAAHGLIADGVADISCIKAIQAAVAALANPGTPQEPEAEPGDDEDDTPVYPAQGFILDVSESQNIIDQVKLMAACLFVIARLWVTNRFDKKVFGWAKEWQAAGFPFWFYVFFKPYSEADAKKVAAIVAAAAKKYGARGVAVDMEKLFPGVSYARNCRYARVFVAELRALGVEYVILYTGEYRFNTQYYKIADIFDGFWLADWGPNDGFVSSVLTPKGIKPALQQHTSYGNVTNRKGCKTPTVPGLTSNCRVDLSRVCREGVLSFFTGRLHKGVEHYGLLKSAAKTPLMSIASASGKSLATIPKDAIIERRAGDLTNWYAVSFKGVAGYVQKTSTKEVAE